MQLGLRYAVFTAQLVSDQDGARQLISNMFDEYGRVIQSTDQNLVTVTNGYDFLGRLTARQGFSQMGGITAAWTTGLESFLYDSRGLTNYFDPLGHPTIFVRDAAGRVLYQTNANQEVLQFTYNPKGQLLTLTDGKQRRPPGITTSTGGRPTRWMRRAPRSSATNTTRGRLTNRWTAAKGNTGYGYDALETSSPSTIHYPPSTTPTTRSTA